jgi:hypothetical protein
VGYRTLRPDVPAVRDLERAARLKQRSAQERGDVIGQACNKATDLRRRGRSQRPQLLIGSALDDRTAIAPPTPWLSIAVVDHKVARVASW